MIEWQKEKAGLFVTHNFFGESEKCHFRFPYKSMTYIAGHRFGHPARGALMTFLRGHQLYRFAVNKPTITIGWRIDHVP
jgi:hypothetical protein